MVMRLKNVLAFYKMYSDENPKSKILNPKSINILDKWILTRLNQLVGEITEAMDNYKLNEAVRPIGDFVEDLSNWYVRRSRSRFSERGLTQTERRITQKDIENDKQDAVATLYYILIELSKLIAPFMPFMAEEVYQSIKYQAVSSKESVHLEEWPKISSQYQVESIKELLKNMEEVKKICSLGLEARQKDGIKVRQPLQKLKVKSLKLKVDKELLEVLADEINVKEIIFDKNIASDVELDIKITPELKNEGIVRELVRSIQDLRKKRASIRRIK